MKSTVRGHFGSYAAAYAQVGARFRKSRNFSIQRSGEYKDYPWTLIYYGDFV